MKVVKFGGSSMADAKQFKKVAHIILSDPDRRIVVVSAPGKRHSDDTKVTDLLIRLAETAKNGGDTETVLETVVERYAVIAADLKLGKEIVNTVRADLEARIANRSEQYEKFLDCMKAAGEDNSAKLMACYLKKLGHEAAYVNPK